MKNSFIRKLSLMPALVMILTMVMSATAFADTLDNVPIIDGSSGQQLGTCDIEYTPNQTVAIDDISDDDQDPDFEVTVVKPESDSRLVFNTSDSSDSVEISWDMKLKYLNDQYHTLDDSDLSTHMSGDARCLQGYDYTNSYVLTATLNTPIEGLPDRLSTSLNYFNCPTLSVPATPENPVPVIANHGEGSGRQSLRSASQSEAPEAPETPEAQEAANYTDSNLAASEPVSPSNKALDNLKWSLNHWASILQGMNDDQLSMMFKDVGVDVDLRGITVLDSQAVLLMKQNNNVVPLNITITFQGKPFVCQIPVGFNFKKFEKSDGSIVIAEIIWELISKQYGLM